MLNYLNMNLDKKQSAISPPKDEKLQTFPYKKEIMIGASSIIKKELPNYIIVLAESQIPAYCDIGNLIFEKKYREAIELGNNLLESTPYSAGIHVNLMDAYFKLRNENPNSLEKSTVHARLAMLYGHNTGYVQKRLVINLEKQGKVYHAMQICNIVLSESFHFSSHGCGNKEEFVQRKVKLEKKINESIDKKDDVLYTTEEITYIIEQIRLDEEREKNEQLEY